MDMVLSFTGLTVGENKEIEIFIVTNEDDKKKACFRRKYLKVFF